MGKYDKIVSCFFDIMCYNKIRLYSKGRSTMQDMVTQDPIITKEAPPSPRRPHWFRVGLMVLLVLLLTATSVFGVTTALASAEQKRRIASLEETLASQSQLLSEQGSRIAEQESALTANSSALQAQENKIKDQENKIKQQENTISDLNRQLVIKKKGKTTAPTTVPQTVPGPNVSHLKDKKLVALTFDDGPGPHTGRLLDAMKARGVKATFFVVGSRVNSYASTLKRIAAEGHEIGNHSDNHAQLSKLSIANIRKNMDSCANKVKNVLGKEPTVMRCPYGSFNANVRSYAAGKQIPIIQWSVDTEDWRYSSWSSSKATAQIIANTFKSGYGGVKNGSIVLMHDIHKNSVDAAITMMDKLAAQGYTMVTVSELLAARESTVIAGKVYY